MNDSSMLSCALAGAALAALACLGSPAPATAAEQCLTANAPPISAPAHRLRFGITPQLAGTVGSGQGSTLPEVPARRDAALRALKPRHRTLVVRLNRLFEADGRAGIRRFARRARAYAHQGFAVESQVRYHPAPEQEGDMRAWRRFVRRAARTLGRNPALVALTITNEVNLPLSANTSDGAFARADDAIVKGVPAARRVLDRIGREDVKLGFSYAYRYTPSADAAFWQALGTQGDRRFRRAVDYVGVQLYPGLFWPPVLITQSTGEATIEGLTIVRDCYMPQAKLGRRVRLWISENGYATNLLHTEARQAAELADTLQRVHAYAGTLGISDYRYFNLRDNRPNGTDLFDDVGLLRADYSRKPAFRTYRQGIRALGRPRPGHGRAASD